MIDTDRLLGVDFVVRGGATGSVAMQASHVRPANAPIEERDEPQGERNAAPGPAPRASTGTEHPATDRGGKQAALDALRDRHDRTCPHCTVATSHTQTVFGEGNPDADVMFVGEAPGETEDRLGRPFVGRAGQKLDEIIAAMGLQRSDVYIANVLKSRPPDNRTPLRHEVEACGPFLEEQIRIIAPKVIVTLGAPATRLLMDTQLGITRLRGVWSEYRAGDLVVPLMPTFHPAYLLRNYTVETRRQVWSDMQAVLGMLGRERE